MWIRSQDRKKLIDVKMINYWDGTKFYEMEKRGHWITLSQYEEQDENVYFGKYATEERALEVLDEIQEAIRKSTIALSVISGDGNGLDEIRLDKLADMIVYNMPQE